MLCLRIDAITRKRTQRLATRRYIYLTITTMEDFMSDILDELTSHINR